VQDFGATTGPPASVNEHGTGGSGARGVIRIPPQIFLPKLADPLVTHKLLMVTYSYILQFFTHTNLTSFI